MIRLSHNPDASKPVCRAKQSIPACLPEQLLWAAVGDSVLAVKLGLIDFEFGTLRTAFQCVLTEAAQASSIALVVATWTGSPLCEAQAIADCLARQIESISGPRFHQRQAPATP